MLGCNHHHDDLLKAGSKNSFAELILKKDQSKVIKEKSDDEFILSKFLCKNVIDKLMFNVIINFFRSVKNSKNISFLHQKIEFWIQTLDLVYFSQIY